jgi:selenocysteine-specific elongation factor
MRVIGTAGHVDHGKSTLIAALTGTHPDRLKEEQRREMTIELGFGWMTLPNGEEVGIVDVPGHRDFIENMLSGIGGIDAALLVIAADEGVMPQTREHLAILDLLQIPAGLIVLTKTDLAPDSSWLELVESDIRAAVSGTVMKHAPIIRVSAKTKTGLESLVSSLESPLSRVSRSESSRLTVSITVGTAAATAGESSTCIGVICSIDTVTRCTVGVAPVMAAASMRSFRPNSCAVSVRG